MTASWNKQNKHTTDSECVGWTLTEHDFLWCLVCRWTKCWLAVSPHLRTGWVGFLLHAGSHQEVSPSHTHTHTKGQVWKERSVLRSPARSLWKLYWWVPVLQYRCTWHVGWQTAIKWSRQMTRWTWVQTHSSNLIQVYSVFVLPSL